MEYMQLYFSLPFMKWIELLWLPFQINNENITLNWIFDRIITVNANNQPRTINIIHGEFAFVHLMCPRVPDWVKML